MTKLEDLNSCFFFDTETVGLNPNYIISLAYRYYERGKKPVFGMIECNPLYPINERASATNGYYDEDVQKFKTFEEQWKDIEPMMRDSLWIGHNVVFDVRALRTEFYRSNIPEPHHWTLDTLVMARQILANKETVNHKLITLCEYYNITDPTNSDAFHAADFDIWATDKVFRKFREVTKDTEKFNTLFIPKEATGDYTGCEPPKNWKNNFMEKQREEEYEEEV